MSNLYELQPRFTALFDGLKIAYGTGRGEWVKRTPTPNDWLRHLKGEGPGIGIAPLRPDNTVMFAAIDLDEPDFDAAREMQRYIPGASFIERSRSGNAHIWVFFKEPLEAWIAMGILKEATRAAGKEHVEVFPKNHDFAKVSLGNYVNLPYHGQDRPIICSSWEDTSDGFDPTGRDVECEWPLDVFLEDAQRTRNASKRWEQYATHLRVFKPEPRESTQQFGTQPNLHICAQHIVSGDAGPITEGHRSIVYYNLAKQLTNWEQTDHEEVVATMRSVNEFSAPDSLPDRELLRIIDNAENKQFTSTGCDDPVFMPYAHPDCPIAYPQE